MDLESAVYICQWARRGKGYRLWTKDNPEITGSGPSYAAAEAALLAAITDAGGAMAPTLEFDPPLPPSADEERYARPELFLVCGNDGFETTAPRTKPFESAEERERRQCLLDGFYESPTCRHCGQPTARRNAQPLSIDYWPPGYDGALGTLWHHGSAHAEMVSERFLALLTKSERDGLVLLEAQRRSRRGMRLFELVGPPGLPRVAARGVPVSGWRCPACALRFITRPYEEGVFITAFVAADDLPRPLPGAFTVGGPDWLHLCITGERWREMVGRPGTRGMVSEPLGVVRGADVVRDPDVPLLQRPWGT